jgi:hypothetical protein
MVLYIVGETPKTPQILHFLLIINCNPLIFTEIAFPNIVSNIISNLCSSIYILYAAIFIFYTHKVIHNNILNKIYLFSKLLLVFTLYIVTIVSYQHETKKSITSTLQWVCIIVIMIPICNYWWHAIFVSYRLVHHRNILFIILTVYYFLLYFFSGYIVSFGWEKIVSYVLILTYGANLAILIDVYHLKKPQ